MRTKKGTIVSKSGEKTVVIEVHRYRTHPKYKKRYRISKKFHAHDEEGNAKVGDEVTIYETRPLSKLKHWTLDQSAAKRRVAEAPTSAEAKAAEPQPSPEPSEETPKEE